jgi:hypothetical protein
MMDTSLRVMVICLPKMILTTTKNMFTIVSEKKFFPMPSMDTIVVSLLTVKLVQEKVIPFSGMGITRALSLWFAMSYSQGMH